MFLQEALKNIFYIGVYSGTSIFVHSIIRRFSLEIKTLKDFLPICVKCKKIRDDKGYWNQVESYISKHTATEFSHGICPHCAKEFYGYVKK